jgi:hypothetical protein
LQACFGNGQGRPRNPTDLNRRKFFNMRKLIVGDKVKAKKRIVEGGDLFPGKLKAKFPSVNYIHADQNETGIVVYRDEGLSPLILYSVKWDRTKTICTVRRSEISFFS